MRRWTTCGLTALALAALMSLNSAPACSLCDGALRSQTTFRQEFEQAKIVLYGTLANPQFKPGAAPGTGTTEFRVDKVIKSDPALAGRNKLELPKYIPVLDMKNPPKYVVFVSVKDNQLNPYHGRLAKSDSVLSYLKGVQDLRGKDRTQQLLYFFKYLDSADDTVSQDAFLEFAQCNDKEIGDIAKHLPAEKLRAWLKDSKTPSERLGLYAFLLGAGGNDKDAAALLRQMIEHTDGRTGPALDGLLSGYINLKPREGWDLAAALLADAKKPLTERFAVARTLRFYHAWKAAETQKEVLRCLAVMVQDGEIADIAIDDLRQWKMWDLTKEILAVYEKPSHASPIARNNIIRYALCCTQPEAERFVAALSQRDPELVAQVRESLETEKGN
jgi:hypothetical protein